MSYLGRSAKLSLKAQEKVSFLATAGQTVKTGLSYTPSFIEVYVNGVLLTDTTDFTATNGNSVTFTVALLLNDEVTVISLKTFTVADHYSKTEADTLLSAKATNTAVALKAPIASPSFTGGIDVTGTVVSDGLTVDGRVAVFDTTQTMNGGISTEVNAGILNFGLNEGSANRFGGSYTQANQGGMLNFDTRAGQPLFQIYTRAAGTAAATGTASFNMDGNGKVGINQAPAQYWQMAITSTINGNGVLQLERSTNTDSTFRDHVSLTRGGSTVGTIKTNHNSTQYNTTSDYRLKENVTPMSGATAQIKLLKPCNFDWKTVGGNVNGFLAHELAEVVPEAVSGTKDAMMDEEYEVTAATDTEAAVMGTRSVPDLQGIDQSKLVPLLTATIQELIARIEALEGE